MMDPKNIDELTIRPLTPEYWGDFVEFLFIEKFSI